MMRALLCAVLGHRTMPGVKLSLSLYFTCTRCGDCVRGDFLAARKGKKR